MAGSVAAEPLAPGDGTADFSHGLLTIENAVDQPIELVSVSLEDAVGSIRLVESFVVPEGRPELWISSDDSFPPDSQNSQLLEPLAGFVLAPFPTGEGKQRNVEVVLHLRADRGQEVAGYPSFCVRFTIGDSPELSEKCVSHGFFACSDIDSPSCGPR